MVPWPKLCALIEPFYPKPGNGRPPVGVERMLRMYFLQQWFNLADPAVEDALYESAVMRQFVGIDLGQEPVPDETTVCKFRHLLEEHNLGGAMLETVNLHLQSRGIRISQGTIVDATIIAAPSSTKNQKGERDPEMKQTKKGGQWYFGMKAHVGVDSQTKMIHSAVVTGANQADAKVLPHLLHGEETEVWGDQGYVGQTAVIAQVAPQARDCINRRCLYHGKLNVDNSTYNLRRLWLSSANSADLSIVFAPSGGETPQQLSECGVPRHPGNPAGNPLFPEPASRRRGAFTRVRSNGRREELLSLLSLDAAPEIRSLCPTSCFHRLRGQPCPA